MADHTLSDEDLAELQYARSLLENPGLAARITNVIGAPIERGLERLPQGAQSIIGAATRKSLNMALDFAISTMTAEQRESSIRTHKTIVALTGGAGGAFGLPALAIELPLSTTVMFRSIADIARSEGESIKSAEARLACLEVFALGGTAAEDDATESGYFAVRAALAKALSEAAEYITERGIAQHSAPALVTFITKVAARFGIPVSQKAAAQAIPIVGAAGGALINTLFIDHFQNVARGHFIVRRLERRYGRGEVKEEYVKLLTT